jgi:hypothetical protein
VLEHPQHAALGVGFHFFIADMAVQLAFVEPLDAGLADGLCAAVFDLVELGRFLLVDSADVADGMGEVFRQRVMANELRLDVQPRQAELVDRQQRDLLLGQLIEQGYRHKAVGRVLHRLVEDDPVLVWQVEDLHQLVDHRMPVACALAGHGQVEAGPVVGEDHAVAIEDQPALGRNRQDMDAVVFGDGRVVGEFGDLQEVHAAHQRDAEHGHEHGAGDQAFVDQPGFLLVVF